MIITVTVVDLVATDEVPRIRIAVPRPPARLVIGLGRPLGDRLLLDGHVWPAEPPGAVPR